MPTPPTSASPTLRRGGRCSSGSATKWEPGPRRARPRRSPRKRQSAVGTPMAATSRRREPAALGRASTTRPASSSTLLPQREERRGGGASRDLAVRKLAAAGSAVTLSPDELAGSAPISRRRAALDKAIAGEPHRQRRSSSARRPSRGLVQAQNAPPAKGDPPRAKRALQRRARRRQRESSTRQRSASSPEAERALLDGERSTWRRVPLRSPRMIGRGARSSRSLTRSRRCARGERLRQCRRRDDAPRSRKRSCARCQATMRSTPRTSSTRTVSAKTTCAARSTRCCRSSGCCGISATISRVGARIPSPNGCATARQRRGSGSAGSGTTRLRRSTIPTKPPTAASSPSRAA